MLITETYRQQNRQLHAGNAAYGTSGAKWRDRVRVLSSWGRKPILDYGAGKATLQSSLGPAYRVTNYDPCISGMEASPSPHPVVICGDVLEHVEPDCLEAVLADLRRVIDQVGLLVIHLGPALKTLPDGRNAHLIQQPASWWRARLQDNGLRIIESGGHEREAWFTVAPHVDAAGRGRTDSQGGRQ